MVEPRRPRRRRRSAPALPGVQADVVVVVAGGEEGGEAETEQGRRVAEIQETARCGEKSKEDKVAHAEAETQG